MFSNVKNQIGGIGAWIQTSLSKFTKVEEKSPTIAESEKINELQTNAGSQTYPSCSKDSMVTKKVTIKEGGPSTTQGNNPDEQSMQSKAVASAKSLGNFLVNTAAKAGTSLGNTTQKIIKLVEVKNAVEEFNREQENFPASQSNVIINVVPPWFGFANEESLKAECLTLSTDTRNFIRGPPPGIEFKFDFDAWYPIALAVLKEDPNLAEIRYQLVPKVVSEKQFWKNYFYRVNLICQPSRTLKDCRTETPAALGIDENLEKSFHENNVPLFDTDKEVDDWENALINELKEFEVIENADANWMNKFNEELRKK